MKRTSYFAYFTLTALSLTGLALAQNTQNDNQSAPQADQQNTVQQNNKGNRGWRRVEEPAPADANANESQDPDPGAPQAPPPAPRYNGQPAPPPSYDSNGTPSGGYQGPPPRTYPPNYQTPRPNYPQRPPASYQQQAPPPPQVPIPTTLTIKPGTYVTVRVNQVLSSDHNHPGDAFAATLVRPIVVDGVVVAQRGQTIGGRVAEAKKAGMVEGTSKLGIQLTDLSLADGQNFPVQSQLISRDGPTSVGRDAGAIAGTTALGAAAGAAADWGRGAAIGAGAGAAAGIIGVLLTRGRPTIIYPEQTLTFKLETAVTFNTDRAPQAFRYVQPGDYQQTELARRPGPTMGAGYPAPYYYGRPYYYGPGYYPYYYGPSFYFYRGRRW